jgi:predicted N-formylglutamate amidohydrolase
VISVHQPLGYALLGTDDPVPFDVRNSQGPSEFLIVCEHGGRKIPARLESLGLGPDDLARHIAYDIGAAELSARMAELLDAQLLLQPFSRLVIDCNRPPHAPDSIPAISDGTRVPGNAEISLEERRARFAEIHRPFELRVREAYLARSTGGRRTILLNVHSFTQQMRSTGDIRVCEVGLLFNRDSRLALAMFKELRALSPQIAVVLNEPYDVTDDGDFTIPVHGERAGIPHVMIEVRNDLISDDLGREHWARTLCTAAVRALRRLPD